MTLKETFKYVANNKNNIYNLPVPEDAKTVNVYKVLNGYHRKWWLGHTIQVLPLSAITFVPTKRKSHYWSGRQFKLILTGESKNMSRLGWIWTPNGGADIFDIHLVVNARIDCDENGLMRYVCYDNHYPEDFNSRVWAVWRDGKFEGIRVVNLREAIEEEEA